MTTLIFPYKEKRHPVFSQISRPLIAFDLPVAIALENNVPPILGRRDGLDRFVARFVSGEELVLEV